MQLDGYHVMKMTETYPLSIQLVNGGCDGMYKRTVQVSSDGSW